MARELKLGLNTGYWPSRPPGPPPGIEATIAEAERLGFDSMWTAEAYGSDVLTPLAWWGAKTERIRLGTAIVQMSARTPTATAMAAMTMDHLSGGRFILGLGVSGPQVVEGWYGQPFAKRWRARASTSPWCATSWRARARSPRRARTTRSPIRRDRVSASR
jgi:alkanesulfonate monooxygenase SsuD/methylene tetrahydromethanopterin reductase-like flavin-dependent oxidoreductase (luciferase family)